MLEEQVEAIVVRPMSVIDADPLAPWLSRRHALRGDRLAVAAVLAEVASKALQVGWGFLAGDPHRGPFIGWGDWSAVAANALFSFVVTPAVWAAYAWIYHAPAKLFADLDARDLFSSPEAAQRRMGTGASAGTVSRPWVIAAVLVTSAAGVSSWLVASPSWRPYILIQLPVWVIGWYMLSIAVARHVHVIHALRDYFGTRPLRVRPLHPDGCGGLGPINAYAHRFALVAAACALGLTLYTVITIRFNGFGHYAPLHFAMGAYFVLSPFCFFATLGTAHRSMLIAKDELLQTVSDAFQDVYRDVQQALGNISSTKLEQTEKMERLQKLYDTTRSFPVWPFNWGSIQRFVVVVLSPLVPLVAQELVPRILKIVL
jgi:hypothetical protein